VAEADTARAVGSMLTEGSRIIRERIEKYDIKCDLKKGSIIAAWTPKHFRSLEKKNAELAERGA
jgi:gamma-glutamylputrescine oxidase